MSKQVNIRSSKQELFDAYQESLNKLQEQDKNPQQEKKKNAESALVEKVSALSVDSIIQSLNSLRLDIAKMLDALGERLIVEHKKFNELTNAVSVEQQTLEELFSIKVQSDSLSALLAAQKERQMAFESEMTTRRQQWKIEQDQFESARKEYEQQIKKDREREKADYQYNLTLERKRDEDVYAAKKISLEKELLDLRVKMESDLNSREKAIAEREKQFSDLQRTVEEYPKQLDKAIHEATVKVRSELELQHKHEIELRDREIEGDRKLQKQTIDTLQTKIKEMEEQIKRLTLQSDEARKQVNGLALKALESASTQRPIAAAVETKTQDSK